MVWFYQFADGYIKYVKGQRLSNVELGWLTNEHGKVVMMYQRAE